MLRVLLALLMAVAWGRPATMVREVELSAGWNLMSFDVQPVDGRLPEALESIAGSYELVLGFDPVLGGLTFDPELIQFSTLGEMDGQHGYWIWVSEDCALLVRGRELPERRPIQLDTGWNLISYLPDEARPVEEALRSIEGRYLLVRGSEPGVGTVDYDPAAPGGSTLQEMKPGRGYWVKMRQPGVLVYGE